MYQKHEILADMLHQLAYNQGIVNSIAFINKCQLLYGRTETKIIEYLKLLEATNQIIVKDWKIELVDKSRVKTIWKPKKKEVPDKEIEKEKEQIDKILGLED